MKKSYNLNEAAEELGVSRRTIERAIRGHEIESYKIRNVRRIEAEELQKIKKSVCKAA